MERAKILIVDDESDHRFLLAAALHECAPDGAVTMASTVDEALAILAAEDIDAVLCDYSLAGRTGLQLLHELRATRWDIPFLLITNHGSEEVARRAFLEGAADYVTKEAAFRNPADLFRKLRRAVERRRLESEKQKAEAILESFLENNPYAILIFSPEGRIVRWNGALARLRSRAGDLEALVDRYNPLKDEQLEHAGITALVDEALAGRWVELPPFRWDPKKAGLQGSARVFRGVAFPIAVTGEAAPHLCAMIQDVTEQETARRERDEYAAILARLLDATDAAIFFVAADLRVRFANRLTEGFFGVSPQRIIGKPMPALLEDLAASSSDAADFLARTREMYEDLSLERDEDLDLQAPTRRHVCRKSGPVRDGAGRILGRIEVYTDQTEAVEKRQLLEAQNRELDAFASRLAHDLKTPLVSLKGFVDLLHRQHGPTLDERGALYLEKVRSSAGILAEMVDGLRDLVHASEAVAGCASLAPLPVLRMVSDALAPEAAERGVEVSLPQTSPGVRCDRAKLFQMFQNLLSNAIRHSDSEKPQRWVRVQVLDGEPDVEIRLTDNGVGLEDEELPEIFQPFRRGRRAAGKPGMGLGLAITRRIAQVCGGRVEARSLPGEGSTFSLFLPRGD